MRVLGLESTCDETACAIVQDGKEILSNIISSQIDLHNTFGGVVPELACRRHIEVIIPIIKQALAEASLSLNQIDLFAVSQGPGLVGALLIGINAAKALSLATQKPIIGINHVEAHLYAALMSVDKVEFPCLGVVLSGGHTSLIYMENAVNYQHVAFTVDDAIGEAFDKVAKLLHLPYPGGPEIERLALEGDIHRYKLKAGFVKEQPHNFSFSGLKTAVLYAMQNQELSHSDQCNLAASFQHAAFTDVIAKTIAMANQRGCKTLVFGGGVTNNKKLREMFAIAASSFIQIWPAPGLSLDNAAMIAGLGYARYLEKGADSLHFDVYTHLSFGSGSVPSSL